MAVDLKWDDDLITDQNGDVLLVSGRNAFIQRKKIWFETVKGSLFYDKMFGSRLYQFIQIERTDLNELALKQVLLNELVSDPEIIPETIHIEIVSWQKKELKVMATFNCEDTRPIRLDINITQSKLGVEIV